jgi:hypothetical protein
MTEVILTLGDRKIKKICESHSEARIYIERISKHISITNYEINFSKSFSFSKKLFIFTS